MKPEDGPGLNYVKEKPGATYECLLQIFNLIIAHLLHCHVGRRYLSSTSVMYLGVKVDVLSRHVTGPV